MPLSHRRRTDASPAVRRLKHLLASMVQRHRLARPFARRVRERADARALRKTRLLDVDDYLRRYPDVATAGMDPCLHYARHGSREGRDPGPRFDARDYLRRYPDVAASKMDPLIHYIRHGHADGRSANPVVDSPSDAPETSTQSGSVVAAPTIIRSRGSVLRIAAPVASMADGKLTLRCDIDGAPSLRAVHDGPADVLSRIEPRVEPFLPVALIVAGAARRDLVVEPPVDTDYLSGLRLNCVPLLRLLFGFPLTGIEATSTEGRDPDPRSTPGGRQPDPAALLFSGGIDSFYSLVRLRSIGYPLRMVINVHAGAHCHEACATRRQRKVRRVASEAGLDALTIDTNFHQVVDIPHLIAHPFRTIAAASTAYPSIRGIFHSSSQSYEDVAFDVLRSGADGAGTTVTASFAWPRIPVTEVGYEKRRFDKLAVVADEALSYGALDVCVSTDHPPGAPTNCGQCFKCARTILSLDHVGRLDRYAEVFDLDHYADTRTELLDRIRQNDFNSDRDLLARLHGRAMMTSGIAPVDPPPWASDAEPGDAPHGKPRPAHARSKPPIRLYWWHGETGDRNAGDELSPLIVEHVSGREVEWAPPETCDLAAIGSVIEVIVRSGRTEPIDIWGTGFIADGPTLADVRMRVAAIRGPRSAARLGVGDTVPRGDPGLLANLLQDASGGKTRALGIVPHHLELDLPTIEAWRAEPGVVISPLMPPRAFVDAIGSCEVVLSSSLHGLVVADALGIPNAWVRLSDRVEGNGFKHRDHLQCLGRAERARELPPPDDVDQTFIDDLVNDYAPVGLSGIQERLLDAFPSL